jgi:hypothetical protein
MSEYQTREAGNMIDSVARHHKHPDGSDGGQRMHLTQPMEGSGHSETLVPFHIRNALMTFPHREPTDDELKSLPRFLMVTPRTTWIPPNHVSDDDILPVANDNVQAACLVPSPGSVDSETPKVAAIGATERGVQRDRDQLSNDHVPTNGGHHDNDSADAQSFASSVPAPVCDDEEIPTVIRFDLDDTGNEFHDAHQHDADDEYYFDPTDREQDDRNMKAFHLTLDYEFVRTHEVDTMLDGFDDHELFGFNEPFDTYA